MSDTSIKIPNKQLFRPDEVADIFSVTRQTVYNWRQEGKILGVKAGKNTLRFNRSEIIRILKTDTNDF